MKRVSKVKGAARRPASSRKRPESESAPKGAPPVSRKLIALVLLVGLTLVALLAAVFGEQGVLKVRHLAGEREELEDRVAAIEEETRDLRGRVLSMQNEPFLYEKAARERLGLVKQGEVVYDFRSDPLDEAR